MHVKIGVFFFQSTILVVQKKVFVLYTMVFYFYRNTLRQNLKFSAKFFLSFFLVKFTIFILLVFKQNQIKMTFWFHLDFFQFVKGGGFLLKAFLELFWNC
eukprot:TRINITY_DN2349_c2_g1_i1.p7 TRINITY_DN2349_c2_g1~~TRINITY_DN2349_c2_g1_i1.p7  ORF type:complete len:100 (+),score=5.89 TRINITY_DN2349_c2_g1_i1:859-1158(+)